MIKINLLRGPDTPWAGAEAAGPPLALAHLAKILLGSLVVSFAVVGSLYWYWSRQIRKLDQDLAREKKEAARLATIEAENKRYLQQLNELETRIRTVQMLQNKRLGPVELFNALGDTVNRTKGLYLLTVSAETSRLLIQGQSDTVEAIVSFIAALKSAGTFDDVQLRQFFQDDQDSRRSFKFNLDCVFQPPSAVTLPGAQSATVATVARAAM